jgi:hypothetical protein
VSPRQKAKSAVAAKPAVEGYQHGREVKLRVPERIMEYIEGKARADRRPINATIVTILDDASDRETMDELFSRHEALLDAAEVSFAGAEVSFARYSTEINWQVLSRRLIETVDIFLQSGFEAEASAPLRSALNELRVVRAEMQRERPDTPRIVRTSPHTRENP